MGVGNIVPFNLTILVFIVFLFLLVILGFEIIKSLFFNKEAYHKVRYIDKNKYNFCLVCGNSILKIYDECPYCGSNVIKKY